MTGPQPASFLKDLELRLGIGDAAARALLGDWLQSYQPGPRAKALRETQNEIATTPAHPATDPISIRPAREWQR